ncbi:hypothetical protein C8J55DRAFT_491578 [Lentinula edodes]|uniref:Homeobox domain-containing protein n=1 Tax=Lentinula lateritia TaxID=40482 RepID=A0A9W9DHL1_9AGAR|nr:hypothetical protein C8J55DRAFT_491578 [Lentinula edodes]
MKGARSFGNESFFENPTTPSRAPVELSHFAHQEVAPLAIRHSPLTGATPFNPNAEPTLKYESISPHPHWNQIAFQFGVAPPPPATIIRSRSWELVVKAGLKWDHDKGPLILADLGYLPQPDIFPPVIKTVMDTYFNHIIRLPPTADHYILWWNTVWISKQFVLKVQQQQQPTSVGTAISSERQSFRGNPPSGTTRCKTPMSQNHPDLQSTSPVHDSSVQLQTASQPSAEDLAKMKPFSIFITETGRPRGRAATILDERSKKLKKARPGGELIVESFDVSCNGTNGGALRPWGDPKQRWFTPAVATTLALEDVIAENGLLLAASGWQSHNYYHGLYRCMCRCSRSEAVSLKRKRHYRGSVSSIAHGRKKVSPSTVTVAFAVTHVTLKCSASSSLFTTTISAHQLELENIVSSLSFASMVTAESFLILLPEHNRILTMYGTKQKRKIFEPHQIQVLNTALEKWNNYPPGEIKKQLAKELNLTNQEVKNHRQKLRREITETETPMPEPSESYLGVIRDLMIVTHPDQKCLRKHPRLDKEQKHSYDQQNSVALPSISTVFPDIFQNHNQSPSYSMTRPITPPRLDNHVVLPPIQSLYAAVDSNTNSNQ